MKHADPVNPEQKEKFGARDIAKSVFVFLANYVLLFAIIFLLSERDQRDSESEAEKQVLAKLKTIAGRF